MTEIITSNADAIFFDPFLMRAKDTTSNERLRCDIDRAINTLDTNWL